MRMAPHINLQSPHEKMGERDSKDSHVDDSVGDVDDEHGKEVESLFVHQREVEEEGDRQGDLGKHNLKKSLWIAQKIPKIGYKAILW